MRELDSSLAVASIAMDAKASVMAALVGSTKASLDDAIVGITAVTKFIGEPQRVDVALTASILGDVASAHKTLLAAMMQPIKIPSVASILVNVPSTSDYLKAVITPLMNDLINRSILGLNYPTNEK